MNPPIAEDSSSNAERESGPGAKECSKESSTEGKPELAASNGAAAEHIRRAFAGTGRGVPTKGFAAFIRAKLPAIRHAGAVVRLAQEYAHEINYGPRAPVFQCTRCRDEGFVLPGGQFCECPVGVWRRKADEQAISAGT